MKYLLHSEDATYDTATKKWTFDLDQRISNPREIILSNATFECSTDTSPFPSVVYMRSDALHNLIRHKHTVELKGTKHENASNVIAVLSETHTRGRYRINGKRVFRVNPNSNQRVIDIYFTNGSTILDGTVTGSGGGGGGGGAVTDATIEAFNDLTVWLDLAPARTLTAAYAECSALGDLPKHLYSRLPTPAGLIMTGNWDFELVNMKTGLLGISRDTDPSLGHGQALNDSSYPTSTWTQEFQVHHIWKSGSIYSQTSGLFKLNYYNCYVWPSGNGAINFRNSTGQNITLSNINWIPNRVYLTSIKRVYNTSTSAYEFHWRHEDIEVASVVTEVTDAGAAVVLGTQVGWSLGISGMYYRHVGGPLIGCNGIDQTEYDNAITWIKNWYGTEEESGSGESGGSSENASFFVDLDIKTS